MAGSATYTPVARPLDEVRFLVGDTDTAKSFLFDEEIEYLLSTNSTAVAAWKSADAIAAKVAVKIDCSFGGQSKSLSQLFDHFCLLSKKLRRQAARSATMVVTGISEAEKQIDALDTDLVQPFFERGQFDNPDGPLYPGSGRDRLGLE